MLRLTVILTCMVVGNIFVTAQKFGPIPISSPNVSFIIIISVIIISEKNDFLLICITCDFFSSI